MSDHLYDVCIVGAGPAGIIVALELARKAPTCKILLVEFGAEGGSRKNHLDDSLEVENTTNHHRPYDTTVKGLGGTSATWGGRCVMYDDIDFLDRSVIGENATWSSDMQDAYKPYLQLAADYFECGTAEFDARNISHLEDGHIAAGFRNGPVTDYVLERWSRPTRFGERFSEEMAEAANLTIWQGFECRDFAAADEMGTVATLTAREVATGKVRTVQAQAFVISAGAQESTRILLRNQRALFNQLDAAPDALGKYYQSHLSGKIASVQFYGDPKATEHEFLRDKDGTYVRRRFQFTSEFLQKENLLNTAIWLDNPQYHDAGHGNGALSFMYLAMLTPLLGSRLAPPSIAHSITKGVRQDLGKHLWNVVKSIPSSFTTPAGIFYRRYMNKRKLPGVFLPNKNNNYALHFHAEQVPDAANRMELTEDGEGLRIHYKFVPADIDSIIRTHAALDNWLRKCGCGELIYWYPPEKLAEVIRKNSIDGIHQVGTTRIADGADRGVVDKNLKVFGTSNVFICSSSVFPTSGQANPTFLLGVFAARLADHLRKTMPSGAARSQQQSVVL